MADLTDGIQMLPLFQAGAVKRQIRKSVLLLQLLDSWLVVPESLSKAAKRTPQWLRDSWALGLALPVSRHVTLANVLFFPW